jgi:hypothetical protein
LKILHSRTIVLFDDVFETLCEIVKAIRIYFFIPTYFAYLCNVLTLNAMRSIFVLGVLIIRLFFVWFASFIIMAFTIAKYDADRPFSVNAMEIPEMAEDAEVPEQLGLMVRWQFGMFRNALLDTWDGYYHKKERNSIINHVMLYLREKQDEFIHGASGDE